MEYTLRHSIQEVSFRRSLSLDYCRSCSKGTKKGIIGFIGKRAAGRAFPKRREKETS